MTYPVAKNMRLRFQTSLAWSDSNMQYEKVFRYNYKIANYMMGPNCVLPTGGWAQTGSALSVHDFLKRTSLVNITKQGYDLLAPHAKAFAEYEGFDAHANAVSELRTPLLRK